MRRMRDGYLIAGLLTSITLVPQPSPAQYSADLQTNIISGVTSNWVPDYYVGNTNFGDALLIQNSAVLSNGVGCLGYSINSSNNSALITGTGSVWSNRWGLYVGDSGPGNSLVISNGGQVVSDFSGSGNYAIYVGNTASSSNNSVIVTGSGSAWSNGQFLYVGDSSGGNSLRIAAGGKLISVGCYVGNAFGNSISSNNAVVVTDPGSAWTNVGTLSVGFYGVGNSLEISNGGQIINGNGYVGGAAGNSNTVLITGSGSIWQNSGTLTIGGGKSQSNTLAIINGGQVLSTDGYLGTLGNSVLVSGGGSVWSNSNDLYLGQGGSGNSLMISNSGQVIDSTGYLGYNSGVSGSSNNVTLVTEGVVRSAWRNNVLYVGYLGSANSLLIANGFVTATNVVIGAASTTCDNVLELDSGDLIVTNNGAGVLDVRNGQLILNGGMLQADTLVITNPCAQFVHTGGSLVVGNLVLNPNTFRIVSITPTGNDMLVTWMMGPGATNTLQAAATDGSGGYSTNGFADIFIVTNNTTVGTVTNYLDAGAATNTPRRYYRARLVP